MGGGYLANAVPLQNLNGEDQKGSKYSLGMSSYNYFPSWYANSADDLLGFEICTGATGFAIGTPRCSFGGRLIVFRENISLGPRAALPFPKPAIGKTELLCF